MSELSVYTYIIIYAILFLMTGLLFSAWVDPYIGKQERRTLLLIIVLLFSLLAQNILDYYLDIKWINRPARIAESIYGYSIRPVILVLFCKLVEPIGKHIYLWALTIVNMLIYMTAFFSGICFTITENYHFKRGPLGFTCHIISAVLLIVIIVLSMRGIMVKKKRDYVIPIFNVVVIIIAVIIDTFFTGNGHTISFLTVSMVIGTLFYYIWLHLMFVREHEEDLKAQQRIRIMMSQIQPHFLFNTLSTIQALCDTNPELASETINYFGSYLRNNLKSLNTPGLIPFEKEMEHMLNYANIEMVRFPHIRIEQDIKDKDFELPALTIQPIVENSIRHGVRIRKEGIVTISTLSEPDGHTIIIKDNGKGFDTEAPSLSDGTHIGLNNVRERIERMCGGTFTVESEIDVGTTVTIHIPA